MIDQKKIEQFARQMHEAIPRGIREFSDDVEKKIRQILQAQLTRMDLINREEFDVQTQVLARTREKLDALEKRLSALEEQNRTNATSISTVLPISDITSSSLPNTAEESLIPVSQAASTLTDNIK